MNPALEQAIELLFLGMLTVGLVLGLVVLTGRLLIQMTNATSKTVAALPVRTSNSSSLDPAIVAVLSSAVEVATQGQGRIQKIDSI